jgi:hypothetical protein
MSAMIVPTIQTADMAKSAMCAPAPNSMIPIEEDTHTITYYH